ncbi:N-6 DNA methylase (plasmid) [Limosilactobacillus mucosae]|uniref:N-6 DNA methylase n=1 Tax=Limosilactobacillus mucosae TaxID=97478 RepID=UPI003B43A2D9
MVKSTNEKIISADFHAFLSKELSNFEKKSGIKLTNNFVKSYISSPYEQSIKKTISPMEALWDFILNISYFFNKEDLSTKGIVFTPQNVANELINIVDSKYLHAHAKVLDPAVGSGGLLIAYLNKLLESDPTIDLQKFVSNNLYGIDTGLKIFLRQNVLF